MKKTEINDVMEGYSVKLRMLRRERGLTQEELSFMSGVSMLTISKIENGTFNGNISILDKLARVLNRQLEINLVEYKSWSIK